MNNLLSNLNGILSAFNEKMERIYKNPMNNATWYRENIKQVAEEDVKPEFDTVIGKFLTDLESKIKPVELKELGKEEFADITAKISMYKALNGAVSKEFIKHLVDSYKDYDLAEFKKLCVELPDNRERSISFMEYESQFKGFEARKEAFNGVAEGLTYDNLVYHVNGFLKLASPTYGVMVGIELLEEGA